jgi:osmoprotectant transport system permease protein
VLFGPDLARLTFQHLALVLASLLPALVVGIPLGIWAARSQRAERWIMAAVGLLQTVPALALLAFLITLMGTIGTGPAVVALFLYALLPIVRNTAAGLTDLPPGLRESAQALGLPGRARLRRIELPLASRSILAGAKTSAVIGVGTATIAAFIGAGGYGERIVAGLAVNDTRMLLAGAIPAAALALAVQWTFDALERWIVPAGLRLAAGAGGEA